MDPWPGSFTLPLLSLFLLAHEVERSDELWPGPVETLRNVGGVGVGGFSFFFGVGGGVGGVVFFFFFWWGLFLVLGGGWVLVVWVGVGCCWGLWGGGWVVGGGGFVLGAFDPIL